LLKCEDEGVLSFQAYASVMKWNVQMQIMTIPVSQNCISIDKYKSMYKVI